jgi:hypothetical protein
MGDPHEQKVGRLGALSIISVRPAANSSRQGTLVSARKLATVFTLATAKLARLRTTGLT